MISLITILLIVILVKWKLNPKIDKTRKGQTLLYYGPPGRRSYIEIWQD